MNYATTNTTQNSLSSIFTPSLLSYCNNITFPWPLSSPLSDRDVGHVFFGVDATPQWSVPEVKAALVELSRKGLSKVPLSDLVAILGDPMGDLRNFLQTAVAIILILDQGPRHLCKGVNARYTYDYFGVLARNLTSYLLSLPPAQNPFNITTWASSGIGLSHTFLRISMLLAPLCHSDALIDHELHIQLESSIREQYETQTSTIDPYRETFAKDRKDIYLFANMLNKGPPQINITISETGHLSMSHFVYWIMRYFTAHVAYVEWFGRSPFRNCAVGREDREGEEEWLGYCGK
jgi:uncharacterized protein (DUF924 family)